MCCFRFARPIFLQALQISPEALQIFPEALQIFGQDQLNIIPAGHENGIPRHNLYTRIYIIK